jgi:hypothetical protein
MPEFFAEGKSSMLIGGQLCFNYPCASYKLLKLLKIFKNRRMDKVYKKHPVPGNSLSVPGTFSDPRPPAKNLSFRCSLPIDY